MTNVIKGLGWSEPATATEQGWVGKSGELLVSSRNLLSNRVLQGFATDEEITRWVDIKLAEIFSRRKKVLTAKEENENRLKSIQDKFAEENAELEEKGKTDIESQILFLQRKLELTKIEAEYIKSFDASAVELTRLDEREEKTKSFLKSKPKEVKPVKHTDPIKPEEIKDVDETESKVVEEKKDLVVDNKPKESSKPIAKKAVAKAEPKPTKKTSTKE